MKQELIDAVVRSDFGYVGDVCAKMEAMPSPEERKRQAKFHAARRALSDVRDLARQLFLNSVKSDVPLTGKEAFDMAEEFLLHEAKYQQEAQEQQAAAEAPSAQAQVS